jgi:hypothetical protein
MPIAATVVGTIMAMNDKDRNTLRPKNWPRRCIDLAAVKPSRTENVAEKKAWPPAPTTTAQVCELLSTDHANPADGAARYRLNTSSPVPPVIKLASTTAILIMGLRLASRAG